MDRVLAGADIFTGSDFLSDRKMLIREGKIADLLPRHKPVPDVEEHLLPMGTLLAPGLRTYKSTGRRDLV